MDTSGGRITYDAAVSSVTGERMTGVAVGFGLVGILLTGWLVFSEVFLEDTCPDLLGIPACFLVLAGYVAATAGAWMVDSELGDLLLYVGAGVVSAIAVYLSIGQLRGTASCPMFEGLPMCYMSLIAGSSMLLADQIRRRIPEPRGSRS